MNEQFQFQFLDWPNRKLIDSGSFSTVFKVKNTNDQKLYAVKQFIMHTQNPQESQSLVQNEIFIMSSVESQFTIQLLDFSIGDNFSYIVMDYCDGDLKHLITRERAKVPESDCIRFLYDIVHGMNALRENDFVHRDIKPANILVKGDRCKLIDFTFTEKIKNHQESLFYDSCGTPVYMSPQILNHQPFTPKCDTWSLGILFYELLYGYTPWPMRKIEIYKKCVVKEKLIFPFGKKVSEKCKDFIKKCLTVDEKLRFSWKQLMNHPILVQAEKQIEERRQIQADQEFVDPILKWMLQNIKAEVKQIQIDVNLIFAKYEGQDRFDFKIFSAVLREINPTITTHQSDFLFKILDSDRTGTVEKKEFEVMFADINFRKCNVIINRQIREIVGIIQAKGICLNKLFNQIDKNGSGSLDLSEFRVFIKEILPNLSEIEVIKIFKDIDMDKSGLISKQEFMKHLGYAIVKKYKDEDLIKARAYRNLLNLRKFIKFSGMSPQEIMLKVDKNKNNKIQPCEFLHVLRKVKYMISGQEIIEIFRVIDSDNSGAIELSELKSFLRE